MNICILTLAHRGNTFSIAQFIHVFCFDISHQIIHICQPAQFSFISLCLCIKMLAQLLIVIQFARYTRTNFSDQFIGASKNAVYIAASRKNVNRFSVYFFFCIRVSCPRLTGDILKG